MRKVSNTNRLLALVLCLCMVLGLMPGISLPVFAADAVSYVDYTWNEETGVLSSETKSVTEYTEVTGSTTSMSNGWYVVNGEITISSRITVTGTVHLILVDGAHLTASSGITVNEGNSLYIYAQSSDESTMGKLTAASSTSDATIGGLYKNHAGIIEINGGNINTSMTGSGACIGSSWACGGYHITINGGKVTATNSRGNGAAIGSGDRANMANSQGSVHSITINGGVVNATVEKNSGAAIGGGLLFSGGDITITGGTIVAKTSSRGAAIGGGEQGDGGNITITGGTVVAKNTNSGRGSAGIGGGYQGSGGNITITGGNVTAVGGWGAAGIGGYANAGNIVITGGTINSTGNVRACGIGGGVAGVNGSIAILTSDVKITQGASGNGNIGFGENNNGTGSTMLLDGNTVTVSGAYTLPVDYIIPEGTTLCISSGASLTIPNGLTLTNNGTITVEEGGSLINNDVFVQNGVFTNNGTFTCAHSVITDDWTSENGKHYKECLSGCGTKLEEECSGGVADCLQAGICEVCGEDYIPIDPDNHVSEDTYIEYIDDTNHGLYHTCCQALIEQIAHTPAEGQEATCVGVATCAECGIAYGGNDTTNHASGETKYISNGNGTHILTHACCGNPAAEPESHKVTYTVNGEFTIDAVCKDCGATGSATFAPTAGGTYNGCVFASSYSATGILNGWNAFTKPVITGCCEGGCKNAGEHTVTMTLGDQSVSATFTVARKTLTISEVKAHYKSYDGTSDLNIYSVSLGGVVVYDEGDYDGEWDDVRDDVKLVYDNLVYTLEGVVPGYYDTVNVSGVTITGSDASNYGIAESFEDVPLLDSMGDGFEIHNAQIWITAHDQLLTGDAELDQSQYSVEGLEDQFTLQGVSLYENSYSEIEIDPYSISIYLDGEDVTEYFDITVHNGNLSRVCEGHEYDENGFCATGECSSYEPAVKSQTVDEWGSEIEVYEIYNAGQLYWFAEQINTYGNNYINGQLMDDITVNEDLTAENLRQWTPIGKDWPTYCGMFEGNDYTISGLYVCDPEMDYVGLFGGTDYSNSISNIHLTNSYFEGNSYIGGLFGYAGSNISGCTVSDSVTVKGNSYLGGIAGGTSYGELNNSWSAATVAANENGYSYGGLVGNNSLSINNCYTTGVSLVGANNDSYGGSLNNSYYLSEEETEDGGKTAEQFASGEVAYLLGEAWGQDLDNGKTPQTYPTFTGAPVYKVLTCAETESYSNYDRIKHSYVDGICSLCGAAESANQVDIKISHTVSFDSDLQMNYRIKLADILAAVPNYVTDGAYLVVEKDRYPMGSGEKTVETVTLYPDLTTDPTRLLFNLGGIQSVEMGSELRAVLHFFDAEGNEYVTPVDAYSILDYAQLFYDTYTYEQQPELYTMLIDALNYGSAAQIYFGRRADVLVNAGMDAYQQYATTELSAPLEDSKVTETNDRTITAVSKMGFSVTFADKTEMNAKLTIADGYSKSDITCVKVLDAQGKVVDTLTDFTELSDGRLQVTYYGVKSVQMRDRFYFVAYVGEEAASDNVGYSVEAYAKSNISSTDANLADMVLKCIYYGDSAYAYFNR